MADSNSSDSKSTYKKENANLLHLATAVINA